LKEVFSKQGYVMKFSFARYSFRLLLLLVACAAQDGWAAEPEPVDIVSAAIDRGDIAALQRMLAKEPKLLERRISSQVGAPLHRAAQMQRAAVVKALIDAGANADSVSIKWGFTPLYWAAKNGDLESATALLKAGADPNHNSPHGGGGFESPIDAAVWHNQFEMVKLLVESGAKPEGIRALERAIYLDDPAIAIYLIDQGADPSVNKALYHVARYSSFAMFKKVMHSGVKLDTKLDSDSLLTAASGDLKKVRLLVEMGHPVRRSDLSEGKTPVLVAVAEQGNVAVLEFLLKNLSFSLDSPDPKSISSRQLQRQALDFAIEKKHPEMVKALLDAGVAPTLPALVSIRDLEAIKKRLTGDLPPLESHTLRDGKPSLYALHVAVRYRHHDVLAALAAKATPAELNAKAADFEQSPLHSAVGVLDVKATRILLKAGANANAPLTEAIFWGAEFTPLDALLNDFFMGELPESEELKLRKDQIRKLLVQYGGKSSQD